MHRKIIKNTIKVILLVALLYFGGIKFEENTARLFDKPSLFNSTDLIYINPYASKKTKQIYTNNKVAQKKTEILNLSNSYGTWAYESLDDEYKEYYKTLANVSRKILELNIDGSSQYSNDKEYILTSIDNIKLDIISKQPECKKSVDEYFETLNTSILNTLDARDKRSADTMALCIESFALNIATIATSSTIDQDILNSLNTENYDL